MNKQR